MVFVGRLVLEKGLGVFAETVSQVEGVKALIVGEGPERARFNGSDAGCAFYRPISKAKIWRALTRAQTYSLTRALLKHLET